jgi:RsiW-degrading membrane proteinase PrsW (M82 family)
VRRPAFWLLVGLLLVGAWRLADALRTGATAYPLATTVAVLLFAAYAIPFVLVVRSLHDAGREPPHLLLAAFGWGGLVATSVAVPANAAAHDLVAKLVSPALASGWGPALTSPTLEEPVKVLGVVVIVLVAGARVRRVLDGLGYGALVGLGFQVVEDVMYAVNAVAQSGHGDRVGPVVGVFLLRGFLGGLWSHTLFSALAGAGVGYLVLHRDRRGLAVAAAALGGAWAVHALWNSLWLVDTTAIRARAGSCARGRRRSVRCRSDLGGVAAVAVDDLLGRAVLVEVDHRDVDLAVTVRVELEEVRLAVTVGVRRPQVGLAVLVGVADDQVVALVAPRLDGLVAHALLLTLGATAGSR